jgi:hypothetical protein
MASGFIDRNWRFIAGIVAVFVIAFAAFFWIVFPSLFEITQIEGERASAACVFTCKADLLDGRDLSAGPCLSNEIIPGWVCDVAHFPRLDIDNDPANQCPEYGVSAGHFIEVDEACNIIRGA